MMLASNQTLSQQNINIYLILYRTYLKIIHFYAAYVTKIL